MAFGKQLIPVSDTISSNMANTVIVISAVLSTLGIIIYVVVTILLWSQTKRSADAATVAAQAAKATAESSIALHRPYMGLQTVLLRNSPTNWHHEPAWRIEWNVLNFGTLPASHVHATAEMCLDGRPLLREEGPRDAEVFPNSDPLSRIANLNWGDGDKDKVMSGESVFIVRVLITYSATNGRRYKHTSDARFDRGYGTFSIVESKTEAL